MCVNNNWMNLHVEFTPLWFTFYAVQVIGALMYLGVLALAIYVLVVSALGAQKNKVAIFSAVLVAMFASLRFLHCFLHIIRVYVAIPDLLKHLLFILPIGLCFVVFTFVIHVWHSFVSNATHLTIARPHRQAFIVVLIFNAMVGVAIFTDFITYGVFSSMDRLDYQNRAVGASNIILSSVFLALTLFYVYYGARLLYILRRSMHHLKLTLFRIVSITVVGSLFFVLFAIIAAIEGLYYLIKGNFFYVYCIQDMYCEYVAEWYLELIYIVLQAVPPAMVMLLFAKVPRRPKRVENVFCEPSHGKGTHDSYHTAYE